MDTRIDEAKMRRLSTFMLALAMLFAFAAVASTSADARPEALRHAGMALYALNLSYEPRRWVALLHVDHRVALRTKEWLPWHWVVLSYAAPVVWVASFFV